MSILLFLHSGALQESNRNCLGMDCWLLAVSIMIFILLIIITVVVLVILMISLSLKFRKEQERQNPANSQGNSVSQQNIVTAIDQDHV